MPLAVVTKANARWLCRHTVGPGFARLANPPPGVYFCSRARGADETNYAKLCAIDRKSTRLNSSHLVISYAVFCLKKKKKYNRRQTIDLHNDACHSKGISGQQLAKRCSVYTGLLSRSLSTISCRRCFFFF